MIKKYILVIIASLMFCGVLNASKIKLDQSTIDKISALNINKRYNDPGIFCEDAFNTFFPIYD